MLPQSEDCASAAASTHTWYPGLPPHSMQVAGPTLSALRLFSPKLMKKPSTIWSRYVFGAVEAVPASWVIVAYAAPVRAAGVESRQELRVWTQGCTCKMKNSIEGRPRSAPSDRKSVV